MRGGNRWYDWDWVEQEEHDMNCLKKNGTRKLKPSRGMQSKTHHIQIGKYLSRRQRRGEIEKANLGLALYFEYFI